jgi:hypothetical protein
MELGAQSLADRRRDRRPFPRELEERVAQTMAEAGSWKQRPHALAGAVEAIDEDPLDAIRRLLLQCRALKLPIRPGKGVCTGLLGVAQMPEHTATDHGREIDLGGETATVFFIGQDRGGQGQSTPRQHGDQTLAAKRTDQALEDHGGDMVDDGTPLQTKPRMRRQQSSVSHLRWHGAIAQDEVWEDREHGAAPRALEPPDGDPTQTDAHIMRVAGQTPAPITGRLVLELAAKGQEEGEPTFDKGFAVFQQPEVGRVVPKIDGDGAVFSRRCGG